MPSRRSDAPGAFAIPLWFWWSGVGLFGVFLILAFELGSAVGQRWKRAGAESAPPLAGSKPTSVTPTSEPQRVAQPPLATSAQPPAPPKSVPVTTTSAQEAVREPPPRTTSSEKTPSPDPLPREKPTFANVQAVFQAKCLSCHGGLSKKGGLDLRTLDTISRGGKGGPALKPGKPEQSPLWASIESGEMPPANRPQLSAAEKQLIRAWIAGGAR